MFLSIIRDMSCCACLHQSAALLIAADLLSILCLLLYNIPSGRPLIFCSIRRKKDKRRCQWGGRGGIEAKQWCNLCDAVCQITSFFRVCVCMWCWVFSPKAPPSCSSSGRASGAVASEDAQSGTGEAKRRVSAGSVLELIRTFHHTMSSGGSPHPAQLRQSSALWSNETGTERSKECKKKGEGKGKCKSRRK